MANKVFEYNGKLIRDMGNGELIDTFMNLCVMQEEILVVNAISDQMYRRMSFRERAREIGVYDCEECGNPYCYEVSKGLGATEPTKLEPGFCGQECRDAYNEKADPSETHYPAPGAGTVQSIRGVRF